MTLSLGTAYCSFGGEVEASSTPTICRLSDSRRHQLSAIARASKCSSSRKRPIWSNVVVFEQIARSCNIRQNPLSIDLGELGMKPQKTAFQLPRYCRRKLLKSGRWAYFFEPPTWAREQGCHVKAQPLGEDYAAAVERAKCVLLPSFDSWRSRGLTDMVPVGVSPGSFDWLAGVFKAHQKWKEIDHKTQRLYEQGLALFADHLLKDGTRAGSKQIADFTKGFVDAVYAKLLIVEEEDAEGNIVQRERRRFANAAMTACRRAWFVGQRVEEKRVPTVNPFSKM